MHIMYTNKLVIALSQEPIDGDLCRADELIRPRERTLCMQTKLVIALSQEQIDGFLPKLGHVCYLQGR